MASPDLREKVPDLRAFVQLDILAQGDVAPAAELLRSRRRNFRDRSHPAPRRVLAPRCTMSPPPMDATRMMPICSLAADRQRRSSVFGCGRSAAASPRKRLTSVRSLAQHVIEHAVGAVAAPGLGQRAVKHDAVALRVGICAAGKVLRGALRPHGVGAGRPFADLDKRRGSISSGIPPYFCDPGYYSILPWKKQSRPYPAREQKPRKTASKGGKNAPFPNRDIRERDGGQGLRSASRESSPASLNRASATTVSSGSRAALRHAGIEGGGRRVKVNGESQGKRPPSGKEVLLHSMLRLDRRVKMG